MVLLRTLSLVIGGLCYCLQACAGSNPADQQVNRQVGGNATLTMDNLRLGEELIWHYNGSIIALLFQNGTSKVHWPAKYELDHRIGFLTIIHLQKNDTGDYEAEIPQRKTKNIYHLAVYEDNFINKNPYFIPVIVIVVIVVFVVVLAVYRKKVMRAFSKCFERSRNVEDAEAGQEIPLQALTGSESPDSVSVNAGVVQRDPSSQLPECTVLIQEGNHQVDGRN